MSDGGDGSSSSSSEGSKIIQQFDRPSSRNLALRSLCIKKVKDGGREWTG